jgi:putative secretion ATPase (PEP-CTERM system associated)
MYERFYNLRERPFALSPDPEYLYLSRVHREALDSIRYGIESRAGFIVVTGEIGAGKTTLLQTLLQRLDDRTVVARIVNTMLEPRELLETIALEFGLADPSKSKPALLRDLGMFLIQQRAQGRRPLLVIDEAQNLTAQALEEVRLLSNLETEKSKLLQILLAGQPNLRDKIASPELEQFRQRVAVSYHLMPLSGDETSAYIKFRLDHAALGAPPQFSPEASDLVHRVSGGVPRIINVICDAALVFGYAEERRSIDGDLLTEVIRELETTGVLPAQNRFRSPKPLDIAREADPQPARGIAASVTMPPATSAGIFVAREADREETRAMAAAPVVPETPAAPAATAFAAASQRPSISEIDPIREKSLAAAREAVMQARQLAAAREAEIAGQHELVSRRQAELAAKEQALLQRERQVAEQRRIMGEEYRLLRQSQPGRQVPATPQGGTRPAAASRPSPVPLTPSGMRHASAAEPRVARAVPFWQRIFRIFTGEPALRS